MLIQEIFLKYNGNDMWYFCQLQATNRPKQKPKNFEIAIDAKELNTTAYRIVVLLQPYIPNHVDKLLEKLNSHDFLGNLQENWVVFYFDDGWYGWFQRWLKLYSTYECEECSEFPFDQSLDAWIETLTGNQTTKVIKKHCCKIEGVKMSQNNLIQRLSEVWQKSPRKSSLLFNILAYGEHKPKFLIERTSVAGNATIEDLFTDLREDDELVQGNWHQPKLNQITDALKHQIQTDFSEDLNTIIQNITIILIPDQDTQPLRTRS